MKDNRMNKRKTGAEYEELAARWLTGTGFEILEKNYRCRIGEIDLIARDGRYLVFVEVKYRSDEKAGDPSEAVLSLIHILIMMTGLQGAGKTTTAAKLAGKFKIKGRKVLLTACDVYRPAAIKQLQVNGEKQGVEVFSMGDQHKPVDIAKAAMEHAKKQGMSVVILDTAGRLHIDEAMMEELQDIKANVHVDYSILVVDSMTGQDAVLSLIHI